MQSAIEAGGVLAHYQIIGRLGAGGMGEVYKAQDTMLGRMVAIKVLPPHLLRNDERTRRFVQEARSASSLNHPNIVTIYEIGHAPLNRGDGATVTGADPIHYIAMELIEGVTLKSKIYDEATSLRTLLVYLTQAAEGLAKAHGAGIVHRDLKPENIMVSADGFAKVLDFGLAKLSMAQESSDAHTRTLPVRDETGEGVILGTVAYMAPEQVQGKTADHRSDIFAIGTILYEAATSRRPFVADSDVEVMHKILHDKPEAVADLNPSVPAELRRTIRRCMAKEPERRFQSMKDVAIELGEIVEEFEQLSAASSMSSSGAATAALPSAVRQTSGTGKAAIALGGVTVIGALAFAGYLVIQRGATPASPVSFESMKIRPLTSSGRVFRAPAISPDGKYVAYVTRDENGFSLWVRHVATGSDVPVLSAQPAQITGLMFSPDGNYVYYAGGDDGAANMVYSWLYTVPALGGQPRKVLFDVDTPVAFSPDGRQIAFGRGDATARQNHVMIANVDGSAVRKLASFPRLTDARKPAWSPDGTRIVTPAVETNPQWDVVPMEIDVASGATRRIGTTRRFALTNLEFLADGSALLMSAADAETGREQVWLQPFPDGTPVRVTNDLSDYQGLSMARDGGLVAALKVDTDTTLVVSTVNDTTMGTTLAAASGGHIGEVSVSRSGVIAYAVATGNRNEIVVLDKPGGTPRVLTNRGDHFDPTITADGRRIVYASEGLGAPSHVFSIDADGSNLKQLTQGSGEYDPHISDDGKTLTYSSADSGELWVSVDGGAARRLTERASGPGRVSHDGRHVVFLEWQSAERAAANLKIVPVADGPALLEVPWRRGINLRWRSNNVVTFQRLDRGAGNLFGLPISGGEPTQITKFPGGRFSSYDWTADGGLVLVRTQSSSDIVLISDWRRGK
ncbi:MAG: protein kinase [Vicinamibacterales bacterium]